MAKEQQRTRAVEQCEFCSQRLSPEHRHLLEVTPRKIVCACDPCAMRFENVIGRWKLIPRDARLLPDFKLTDAQWSALALPINLAFLFHSTPENKAVAMYPSPAGAMQSLLPLTSWETMAAENPPLGEMQPDVEALLVNRLEEAGQYYIAPIDICFELSGLIRVHWRGLSGGEKVWSQIRSFFERLKSASKPLQMEAARA
jgi:hypothetical protein